MIPTAMCGRAASSAAQPSQHGPALQLIPTEHVDRVWPLVEGLLIEAADRSRGSMTIEGITDRLTKGDWQLWVVWDGSVVAVAATEVYHSLAGDKFCAICLVNGGLRWMHLLEDLERWAREVMGCKRMQMFAAKRWAKRLPEYKMRHVMLEKDL